MELNKFVVWYIYITSGIRVRVNNFSKHSVILFRVTFRYVFPIYKCLILYVSRVLVLFHKWFNLFRNKLRHINPLLSFWYHYIVAIEIYWWYWLDEFLYNSNIPITFVNFFVWMTIYSRTLMTNSMLRTKCWYISKIHNYNFSHS